MQTFVTYKRQDGFGAMQHSVCIRATGWSLDTQRLNKQRIEAMQIHNVLQNKQKTSFSHPAVQMWQGYEKALVFYGWNICHVWQARGYVDTLGDKFADLLADNPYIEPTMPWWFGHPKMVASHRSKLLHKDPYYYGDKLNAGEIWCDDRDILNEYRLPYLWPDPEKQIFYISKSEIGRHQDWSVPPHWHVDFNTREVTFN